MTLADRLKQLQERVKGVAKPILWILIGAAAVIAALAGLPELAAELTAIIDGVPQ